jgi:hypothetical protein
MAKELGYTFSDALVNEALHSKKEMNVLLYYVKEFARRNDFIDT